MPGLEDLKNDWMEADWGAMMAAVDRNDTEGRYAPSSTAFWSDKERRCMRWTVSWNFR